jgi:hypothetical protein
LALIAYFRSALKTKQLLSKYLFGLSVPQQYVCLSLEKFMQPLKIALTGKDNEFVIVNPVLVGYKPVVWAQPDITNAFKPGEYCLSFYDCSNFELNSKWNVFLTDSRSVAQMMVEVLPLEFESLPKLKLLQTKLGSHYFMSSVHRWVNSLRDALRNNESGNINLPGNLHDQVRIAYSIPRIIALVSISNGSEMNLFPTDLHGQLDKDFYISSLRMGGLAEQQVERNRRIVLCEIESKRFREVYGLGKNHMKDFTDQSQFNLHASLSKTFQFPLPEGVLRYFELTVLESLDVGIHRIFLYKIEHVQSVRAGETLSHIHQYYAEWRSRNGINTELLLR